MRSVEGIIQEELEGDLIRLGWKYTGRGFAWRKDGEKMHYADAISIELKKIKTPILTTKDRFKDDIRDLVGINP